MNTLKTFFFLTLLTLLLVWLGGMIGGRSGAMMAFIFALIMNMGAYWFSDKIVLRMYGAQEAGYQESPELHRIVSNLAAQAGIPRPKIYVIPVAAPNAFATGRNPSHAAVAVTEGILKILNTEELTAVLAHEIAHVQNRDILISTIAATIAGAISMLVQWAQWGAIFGGVGSDDDEGGGGNLFVVIILGIIASLAAVLIQMAISRSREYIADATGSRISGHPLELANALKKLNGAKIPMEANPSTAHMFIINPLSKGFIANLFSTHPPLEARVAELEKLAYGQK
ncbi:MAG: zinc metalloprotease HtpX [bacterium]|nr:zinc metalloprotease HtpX [bacterium]